MMLDHLISVKLSAGPTDIQSTSKLCSFLKTLRYTKIQSWTQLCLQVHQLSEFIYSYKDKLKQTRKLFQDTGSATISGSHVWSHLRYLTRNKAAKVRHTFHPFSLRLLREVNKALCLSSYYSFLLLQIIDSYPIFVLSLRGQFKRFGQ